MEYYIKLKELREIKNMTQKEAGEKNRNRPKTMEQIRKCKKRNSNTLRNRYM